MGTRVVATLILMVSLINTVDSNRPEKEYLRGRVHEPYNDVGLFHVNKTW